VLGFGNASPVAGTTASGVDGSREGVRAFEPGERNCGVLPS
jgi:hypothetical protein